MDLEVLALGTELQEFQHPAGKPHSSEAVVSFAVEELYKSLIADW